MGLIQEMPGRADKLMSKQKKKKYKDERMIMDGHRDKEEIAIQTRIIYRKLVQIGFPQRVATYKHVKSQYHLAVVVRNQ